MISIISYLIVINIIYITPYQMHVETWRMKIKKTINFNNSNNDATIFDKFNTSSLNLINFVIF